MKLLDTIKDFFLPPEKDDDYHPESPAGNAADSSDASAADE